MTPPSSDHSRVAAAASPDSGRGSGRCCRPAYPARRRRRRSRVGRRTRSPAAAPAALGQLRDMPPQPLVLVAAQQRSSGMSAAEPRSRRTRTRSAGRGRSCATRHASRARVTISHCSTACGSVMDPSCGREPARPPARRPPRRRARRAAPGRCATGSASTGDQLGHAGLVAGPERAEQCGRAVGERLRDRLGGDHGGITHPSGIASARRAALAASTVSSCAALPSATRPGRVRRPGSGGERRAAPGAEAASEVVRIDRRASAPSGIDELGTRLLGAVERDGKY